MSKRTLLALGAIVVLGACGSGSPEAEAPTTTAPETVPVEETVPPSPTTQPPTTTEAPTTTQAPTTTAAPTTTMPPTTTAPPLPLAPEDYAIALTVTANQCFNSAGGLVTVEPSFSIVNIRALASPVTLIYDIHGGEHVETASVDVAADGTMTVRRATIDTPTCDVIPTAVITQVIER